MCTVTCFQTAFGRQFHVLEKARAALQHSGDEDVFAGNITVLGGIHVQGVSTIY